MKLEVDLAQANALDKIWLLDVDIDLISIFINSDYLHRKIII